jgi:hypothetical protein
MRLTLFGLAIAAGIIAFTPALGRTAGACGYGSTDASASRSSISIDHGTLPADQTAVLTVQVRDTDGCAIYYGNVELKASTGLDVVRQLNGNSTLNYAHFSLAAAQARTAGSYSYTVYYSIGQSVPVLLGSGTVTFTAPTATPPPPSAAASSIVLDPGSLDVSQTATLTVTIKDSAGSPLSGQAVRVDIGSGRVGVVSLNPAVTDAAGIIKFSVTTHYPGSYALAVYDGNLRIGTRTVTFTGSPPTPSPYDPDAARSTLTLDRNSAPADQTVHLTVTLRNASGNALSGIQVHAHFSTSSFPNLLGSTDSSGIRTFSIGAPPVNPSIGLTGRQPGTYNLVVDAGGIQLGPVTVHFTPTATATPSSDVVDAANSTVVVDHNSLPAGQTAHITVTVRDAQGNPLNAYRVRIAGGSGAMSIGNTNALGAVVFLEQAAPGTQVSGGGVTHAGYAPGMFTYSVTAVNPTSGSSTSLGSVTIEFTAPAAAATPTPSADENGWSANALKYRGRNGQHFTYICPTSGPPFPVGGDNFSGVYGTDTYTDDSPVCLAAVHAGLITLKGGEVTIEIRPRADSYTGSTRNGITTIDYGTCECGSYVFVGGAGGLPRLR